MIALSGIAHGLYIFVLSHDLIQKVGNFCADHALADVGAARQAPWRPAHAAKRRHFGNEYPPHGETRLLAARGSSDRLENERHEGASGRQLLTPGRI